MTRRDLASTALLALAFILAVADTTDAQEMRTLARPRAEQVLSPTVRARLADSERVRAWVYFTDKSILTDADARRALDDLERLLTPRARERRAARGVPLAVRDLPVHGTYVTAVASTGAHVRHRSRWFNAVSVDARAPELLRIARLPFVASIDAVRGRAERPPAPPGGESLPGEERGGDPDALFYGFTPTQYEKAQVVAAHTAGYTGAGVLIAMFDGGFDASHPALRELPLVAERDFVQGDDVTSDQPQNDPPDQTQFGNAEMCHGTATWSCAGGYLPGRMVGVAFGASFAIAKTEYGPYERHVEEDNWAAAAEWADSLGADIISSSLGYRYDFDDSPAEYTWAQLDGKTTIVAQAANIATQAGILVVNSVGNEGPDARTLNSPSDSDSVLAVGAVLPASEVITDFSSRGPAAPVCPSCPERIKPDVLAQGTLVHAATADGCYDFEFNPGQGFPYDNDNDPFYDQADIAGTSFSCPITSGAAALLLEAHPTWDPAEARYALTRTASDYARGIQPSTTRGYGVIRVMDAIAIPGFGGALAPRRPGPFDLISPLSFSETGATITTATPTFMWHASGPGRFNLPRRYDIELSPSIHFDEDLVTMQDVTDTTATLLEPLPAEGFYYWRVRAEDDADYPRESRQRWRILYDHPPQPFDLLSPISNETITESLTPTLRWRRSLDASLEDTVRYTLRIGNSPSFSNPRVVSGITDTTYTVPDSDPLAESLPQYWRVTARDRFGATVTSVTETFLMGAFPPQPFAPIAPAAGDTTRTLRPTLRWEVATDPNPDDDVFYEVYIGDAPDAIDTQIGQLGGTELRVPAGTLEDDQTVYWRAIAEDTFGNRTESTVGSFHTWLAPQPFALTSPPDGGTVYGAAIPFSWAAAIDETPGDVLTYRVDVYGDAALSDLVATSADVQSTSATVMLGEAPEGTLYWRVLATDLDGRTAWSSTTRSVVRSPAPAAFAVRAFPNPLDPRRGGYTVSYDVPAGLGGRALRITVHDVLGRVVRTLAEGPAGIGGDQIVSWDGRAQNGTRAPAGVYFVRVELGPEETISRVVLIGR